MPKRFRVLIADDHLLVAEACKTLLEPEFEVVGVVSDGRALLQAVEKVLPNVVIADISMPVLNGLDACEQISRKNRGIKIIFLTMTLAPDLAAEAFRRGASGYVLKQGGADELLLAVRRVLHGESYLSPLITKDAVEYLLRTGVAKGEERHISFRQREVLQLLAEGKAMKEIAHILKIRYGTVAFHKYRIMETLGLVSNAELIQYALKNNIIAN